MNWIKQFTQSLFNSTVLAVAVGCVESYQPPSSNLDVSYLVVDGFMNTSKGLVNVKLSRTVGLSIGKSLPDELGATVSIESEGGQIFDLNEKANGNYSSNQIISQEGNKYRLRITTNDGEKYSSKFIALKSSPTLDNVIWKAGVDGVTVYVNAHDENNQTHYYKWVFTETWEYTATYISFFKMEGGVPVPRTNSEYVSVCWKTAPETQILIASTLRLDSDVVSDFPIARLPAGTQKLSHSYSILVEQRALDEDAYNYWQLLEKTTESLGGLFDPIPSQVNGNIYNEGDLNEPVLGYFGGGNVEEKRIFIVLADLPDYLKYYNQVVTGCELKSLLARDIATTIGNNILIDGSGRPEIVLYSATTPECGDCRVQGGVTTKPDFWPQ